MRNQSTRVLLLFYLIGVLALSGCTQESALTNDSQESTWDDPADQPVSVPISNSLVQSIPKTISEHNLIVPLCDDGLIPTESEMADWKSVTDDILKVTLHYPDGWSLDKRDETGSTNYEGIPEYMITKDYLMISIGLSVNDRQPWESLLDVVSRHSAEELYPYQSRYETTLGGRQVVLYWNGYNWLTYSFGNGTNVYNVAISNMDDDKDLRNVCGIIANLDLL